MPDPPRLRPPEIPPRVRDTLRRFDEGASQYLITPVVKWIVYASVAVFVLKSLIPLYFWDALFGVSVHGTLLRARLWQLLTYIFVHSNLGEGGLFHILFNLLGLWFFGTRLEVEWGPTRFARLILVAAVGAAVLHLLISSLFAGARLAEDPDLLRRPMIGLTAVFYGVLIAYTWRHSRDTINVYGVLPVRVKTLAWVLGTLAFISLVSYGQRGITHLGHLGGLFFGWLFIRKPDAFDWIPIPRLGHRKWRPPQPRTRK